VIIGNRRGKRPDFRLLFLPVLILGVLLALRLSLYWNTPAEEQGRETVVQIPGGASLVSASRLLADAGVIGSVRTFVFIGKLKGLADSIQAGELMFRTDMSPAEVMDVLTRGKAVSYHVTIPEGYNMYQIASLLAAKGLGEEQEFLRLARDPGFCKSLKVHADTLEGFLFPDTYSWPRGLSEEEMLGRMVNRYHEVFTPRMKEKTNELGMTELQIVTLASIIEKETGAPEERDLVSAVFHNRLKKGYRLQTDPSVIYGLEDFDGNLTKEHLRTDHPYNTYTRGGLPAGPIANPGEASLVAALFPARTAFLYFVARGDGTHVFSNTLVEHNEAVRLYQLDAVR
jgi:UPF0755 protein